MWYNETGEEAKTQDPVWGRPRPDGGGEQDGDQEWGSYETPTPVPPPPAPLPDPALTAQGARQTTGPSGERDRVPRTAFLQWELRDTWSGPPPHPQREPTCWHTCLGFKDPIQGTNTRIKKEHNCHPLGEAGKQRREWCESPKFSRTLTGSIVTP